MLRWSTAVTLPLLLVLACSTEPRERGIPTDASTWQTDAELQKAIKTLPSADERLLQGWMMRHSFKAGSGETIPSRTINEAIEEQRAFNAERKKEKAAKKAAESKAETAPAGN